MGWITTKSGKRINTDWFDEDEKKKQSQINANKQEADKKNGKQDGIRHITADEFNREAKRQGLDLTSDDIEDYVESSYGGINLGDKISKFIDNVPDEMKVQSEKTAYRGLRFNSKKELDEFIRRHPVNSNLESRRDGLSWSMSEEVAREFSVNSSDYALILANEDEFKNAISIKGFADTPVSSEEILYSSSTDFQVIDIENRNGIVYMYVTEAPVLRKKYK